MDKNNIIGCVLIAALLIGFSWWSQPSEEQQRAQFVQDSIATVKKEQAEKAAKLAAEKKQAEAKEKIQSDSTALFYSALNGKAEKVVLKNKKVELTLNTKGGTVEKAVIKGYVGHNINVKDGSKDVKDVTLFDAKDQSLKFMLAAKEANIITSDLYFTPSNVTDSTVVMTAEAGAGKSICFICLYRPTAWQVSLPQAIMPWISTGKTNVASKNVDSPSRIAMPPSPIMRQKVARIT